MSKNLRSELIAAAHDAGGSFKTRENRESAVSRFASFLKAENVQIKKIEHIKHKHVEKFVRACSNRGLSARTIQNEISALRTTLAAASRAEFARSIDNKKLGIAGASRDGTKTAMSEEKISALRAALTKLDVGVAAAVELQRALGLRGKEAVMSSASLKSWEKQLESRHPVNVVFGTKGGRPRFVNPADRSRALHAVKAALSVAQRQSGRLIDKPDLKSALARYTRCMHAAGATGRESGHALRYAFAQAQIRAYEERGLSRAEALAATSCDLGHGDGRGRWIEQVYSR